MTGRRGPMKEVMHALRPDELEELVATERQLADVSVAKAALSARRRFLLKRALNRVLYHRHLEKGCVK